MDPFRQLRFAVLAVIALVLLGTLGFRYIEGLSILNAIYMTIIVLTTVGLEVVKPLTPQGKVFVIVLSVSGIVVLSTVVLSAINNAIEIAASDKIQHIVWRKKMERIIKGLNNHYIICGYGRMGQAIAGEFLARKTPFVVIENNPEQLPRLVEGRVPFVEGDASDETTLRTAGVERAKGLISVAPTDADNTFIVLTAKGINPKLFVVARSIKSEDEPKLIRAGADRVISPYILGGKRMAWAVLRPTVIDFLDTAIYSENLELEISETKIEKSSPFKNKTVKDLNARECSGATIIAIKSDGTFTSSPPSDMVIHEGDILIAVGTPKQLEKLGNVIKQG